MDAPENKNTSISNLKQEQDDYLFHLHIMSLLSVEEHVSIEELLGNRKPDVGSMTKDSVETGRKPRCQCRKSSCNTKSCSCSKGRVGCSISCKCRQGCENIFGRNDSQAGLFSSQNQELGEESNAN